MAVTVKKAVLWRRELENQPGTLAEALKPLADAKVNLQVVMGYVLPGDRKSAALEVYPISGAKAEQAAVAGGLAAATAIPCLIVQGDDRVGLAHKMADSLAKSDVNIHFSIIEVIGKKFLGVFGFEDAKQADTAAGVIKIACRETGKAKKSAKRSFAKRATKAKRPTMKKAGLKKKTTSKKSVGKGLNASRKKPATKTKSAATRRSTKKTKKSTSKHK